ncbi:Protein-tyrosine phosphatase, low molecular weight [Melia azedarach]|uniref:Protein-tyrosine phosphatase, low molecular weight n=1 Tax=Melia azedarach TaxID=155640 RepID=A0ACC1YP06_MELAZ|nr:Protein-tyrosine phosphatase, low molecular weight [Melia azedarach]
MNASPYRYRTTSTTRVPAALTNLRICHIKSLKSPFLSPTQNSKFPVNPNIFHNCYNKPSCSRVCLIKPSSMASSGSGSAENNTKPLSVLFVCLGNICRSPAAEGVFRDIVKKRGLDSHFKIDSAGTIGYHEGNLADPRMRAASKTRGIDITSISRPIRPSDFKDFDLVLAMDEQNREDILGAFNRWKFRETLPADAHKKVRLMCSYCKKHDETEVPDPYYGGAQGFEKVLDLLEDACESLLDSIVAENSHIFSS